MSSNSRLGLGRRGFLQGVAVVTGTVSLASPSAIGAEVDDGVPSSEPGSMQKLSAPAIGYQSLGPEEVGSVEALVNVMCPADRLTPNGVDCGLAVYIDRQLAGGFGKGERLYMRGPWRTGKPQHGYQLPLTPEQFFKAGLVAANEAAGRRYGRGFSELKPDEADAFLHDLAAGRIADASLPIEAWFNELVYPLFVQACFADPIYGGNIDKVFWRMIGYPGLPAVHGEDMMQFRGRPYPGAQDAKAIGDFS